MRKHTRLLSWLTVFAMVFSWFPTVANAFAEGDTTAFELTGGSVPYNAEQDQTVEVKLIGTSADSYVALQGGFALKAGDSEIALTQMTALYTVVASNPNYEANAQSGQFKFYDAYSPLSADAEQAIITAAYNIPAGTAPGDYMVSMQLAEAEDAGVPFGNRIEDATYTATITVEEPSAPPPVEPPEEMDDFEIYYKLDSNTNGDDAFKNYEIVDSKGDPTKVIATVYMVSNKADATVQAYDIYLNYSGKLKYDSLAMNGAVAYAEGKETAFNKENGDTVVDHIQLVKGTTTVSLQKGVPQSLGTIVFSIDGSAAYGEDLHITLEAAADTENSADAKTVTNISIGGASEGDATSYYPTVKQTVDGVTYSGAEVITTYTIQFASLISGATLPDKLVKQHNIPATLEAASVDGYEFKGWTTNEQPTLDGEIEYEEGASYEANVSDTLYAVWKVATSEYTVKHLQQNVDGTGYVEVEADRQTLSGNTGETTNAVAKSYEGFTAQDISQKTIAADGSTVVEIKYDRNSYDLTWNDGTNTTTTQVKYGAAIVKPADPTKTGYKFVKWDKEIPATMPADDLTINAEWNPITYVVEYNQNTGTGEMSNSTHTYDAADEKLTANVFTKVGYTFIGWNTKTDGTGDNYGDEAVVKNLADKQDAKVTLYAQWQAITYTVKFHPGTGGTGNVYEQTFTYEEKKPLSANVFTATDVSYAFAGWALSDQGEVVYKDQDTVEKLADTQGAVVDLYAVWKQNTISYKADPAGVQMTLTDMPETYTLGVAFEITEKPTATGYTFNGWSCDALNLNTVGEPGASIIIPATATGNIELIAHWTINQYTITFDTAGGTTILAQTKDYGATIEKPADPTKTGFTFAGWSPAIPDTMPGEDITVTANWTINTYTITYYLEKDGDAHHTTTAAFSTAVETPDDPEKVGFTFVGWDVDGDGDNDADDELPTIMPAGGANIIAIWSEHTYNIAYVQGADVQFDAAVTDKTGVKFTESITLPTKEQVTKSGHELTGWSTVEVPGAEDTIHNPGAAVSGLTSADGATVQLYPIWTEAQYDLTFNLGAHPAPDHEEIDSIKVTYNGNYPELPTVEAATGYEFKGWYIDVEDESTKIEKEAKVEITEATELTAKYEAIQYTITLNANGGQVDPASITYDIEDTVTLPTPSNGLYKFMGWKLETETGNWADGTYNAGDYTEKYGVKDQAMVLVAQWDIPFTYAIEDYKYAYTDYVMLRIATDSAANCYSFGGENMFYTDDSNYKLEVEVDDVKEMKSVFVTLIPKMDGETKLVDGSTLTAAGMAKLAETTATAVTIARDGDVNGDGVLNIADANIVYQMVEQQTKGGYYPVNKLDTQARLEADMETTVDSTTDDHRGSIDDVNVIVNKINGVTS